MEGIRCSSESDCNSKGAWAGTDGGVSKYDYGGAVAVGDDGDDGERRRREEGGGRRSEFAGWYSRCERG